LKTYSVVEISPLLYVEVEVKGVDHVDYVAHDDYFARFLEFFLREANFSKLARLPLSKGLLELILGRPDVPFQVIVSREAVLRSKEDLQRNWMNGLDALYVLKQPLTTVLGFCLTAQYRVENRTYLGSAKDGDPLQEFSDPSAFENSLHLSEVKPGECAVLFAHDGDRLYLMAPATDQFR